MDRLEAMSIVLTAVETGSLSAAARQLNTPLATVSRKVTELEKHLQTKLFNRSARKLVLTDAGIPRLCSAAAQSAHGIEDVSLGVVGAGIFVGEFPAGSLCESVAAGAMTTTSRECGVGYDVNCCGA